MANNCDFGMKVKGIKSNVEAFVRAMQWEGEYAEQGVGRIYYCDVIESNAQDDNVWVFDLCGDCAWSIWTAMRNAENPNNIEALSKRLNLMIEVISEEPGVGFMEHFAIDNGEILCDDCIDWTSICIDEIEDDEEEFWENYGAELAKEGITRDNYMDYVVDDYINIGGIEWDYDFI